MRVRHGLYLGLLLVSACRVHGESGRIRDVTPSMLNDSGGLEIEIDKNAIKAARLSVTQSSGTLEMWSMLYADEVTRKMQARIGSLTIDQPNQITAADHGTKPAVLKQTLSDKALNISGMPGRDASKSISLQEKGGASLVLSRELSGDFFSSCPTSYMAPGGKFASQLSKNGNYPPFKFEGDITPSVSKVVYRPRGVTWLMVCEAKIAWPDIPESALMAKISFEVKLDADQVIFPGAASDPNYPALKLGMIRSEKDGYGTRYFRDYGAPVRPDETFVQRWNPLRDRIVIDDMNDSFGRALTQSKQGPWVQEALKIAVADLRVKFPALGNKIVLTSERSQLKPDIAFSLGDAMGAAGIALMLLDDQNGEIRQARIGLGEESNLSARIRMIDGFARLGLIDDPRSSFKDSYLYTVIHELGHTLGLRHNFAAFGLNRIWGNDLQAVMSYAMIGSPIEYVSNKIEWKPHDILSLKILYAELSGQARDVRASLIPEVLKYPLSEDELLGDGIFVDFARHLQRSLKFLAETFHPKFANFREGNPDWEVQIKSIYKEAYDVELKR